MLRHLALVLTTVAVVLSGCGGTDDPPTTTPDTSQPAPAEPSPSLETAPSVAVGAGPVGLAADDQDAVWVVSSGAETVSRIPAGATEPDLVVDVPGVPLRVAAAYGAIWVTSFHGKTLVRIDPASGKVTDEIPTGAGPEGVTAAFGDVWVVAQDAGRLLRIDPETRKETARIEIGVGARLVEAGPDAVYVSQFGDGTVLRVDPRTNELTTSKKVCSGPQGMAVTRTRLWVTCTLDDQVASLDPTTLAVDRVLDLPGLPDPVAAYDGALLLVLEEGPTLVMLDPRSGEELSRQMLGAESALYDKANLDLTVAGDEVWVSSFNADLVHHVPVP